MADDIFRQRRHELEENFFAKVDQELMDKLRTQSQADERKLSLAAASGIQDPEVLHALVELDIDARTLAALSLIPLLQVAWAEGGVDEKERKAILQAAHAQGVAEGSPGHALLERWLREKPAPQVFAGWRNYIDALRHTAEPAAFAKLRDDILDRAEAVAQSAGGFLGMATVSAKERAVLNDLEKSFQG